MRILALDIGDRRIGVALSDPLGILASPLTTIDRSTPDTEAAIDAVLALAEQHEAAEILVGIPYLMSGRIGTQARITLDFAQALSERTAIPITHTDERLSSVQADRMLAQSGTSNTRDKGRTDSAAAAVILQAYLDARN
jgi:putative Holliday junction resolvase